MARDLAVPPRTGDLIRLDRPNDEAVIGRWRPREEIANLDPLQRLLGAATALSSQLQSHQPVDTKVQLPANPGVNSDGHAVAYESPHTASRSEDTLA